MKKAKRARHREPSKASLREIPEIDFTKVKVRKNPYAARIAKQGVVVQIGRGRPKSSSKSVARIRVRCGSQTSSGIGLRRGRRSVG